MSRPKGSKNKPKVAPIAKIKPVFKPATSHPEYRFARPEVYIKNCMFWVTEYLEGKTTKERAISATQSLMKHLNNMPVK